MSGSKQEAAQEGKRLVLERGKELIDSIRGAGSADAQLNAQSEFTLPAHEYVLGNAFGDIWDRPGLELRYRSLVVISILASSGKTAQLKSHVKMGLINGLTEVEIKEALMHVMGYCGFPTGLDAFTAADQAIKEHNQSK